MPAFAARADLVVLSSDSEGLPLVVLEALAAGTPVLSTPVEGMRELRDAGVAEIVPEAGAEALATGIIELLADPRRRAAMGARGRELVAARYSGDAMVDAYERLYFELSRAARTSVLSCLPCASALRPRASSGTATRALRRARTVTLRRPTTALRPSTTCTTR